MMTSSIDRPSWSAADPGEGRQMTLAMGGRAREDGDLAARVSPDGGALPAAPIQADEAQEPGGTSALHAASRSGASDLLFGFHVGASIRLRPASDWLRCVRLRRSVESAVGR